MEKFLCSHRNDSTHKVCSSWWPSLQWWHWVTGLLILTLTVTREPQQAPKQLLEIKKHWKFCTNIYRVSYTNKAVAQQQQQPGSQSKDAQSSNLDTSAWKPLNWILAAATVLRSSFLCHSPLIKCFTLQRQITFLALFTQELLWPSNQLQHSSVRFKMLMVK